MVKKQVPDWLNSSLWSSTPPPDDDRLRRYASNSAAASPPEPAKVDPPVPVPPPSAAAERGPPAKRESEDSRSGDEDNGASGAPSAEDISRQAQLLAEVGVFPALFCGFHSLGVDFRVNHFSVWFLFVS